MIKIDAKDRQILYHLDLNARQSNADLAKKVGLSKDAVGYRIKKMEENKIIRGYNTIIDPSRLGYILYRILFNLIDVSFEKKEELIAYLKKDKRIGWISQLDGAWNFGFVIWVKSNSEFREFFNLGFNKQFKKHIKEKLITPVTSYRFLERNYLLNKEKKLRREIIEGGEKLDYDDIDLKILQLMTKNAKTPLLDLAQALKLSSMTILNRLKRMEKIGIIKAYRVDLNFSLLPIDFYSMKFIFNSLERLKEFETYIKTLPEAIAIIETAGGYDFDLDLEVSDSKRYFQIVTDLEKRFDFIREIIYFRNLINYDVKFFPEELNK